MGRYDDRNVSEDAEYEIGIKCLCKYEKRVERLYIEGIRNIGKK